MSKNGSRLSRLGVLAPAALSACIDASVLAAPAAGALLSTVLNELNKAFMLKKWFHGVMSAQEAEQLLIQKGKQGSYLVRESRNHPGEYVLSVRVRSRVSHVLIRRQQNKYNVGSGEFFDDLSGLIEHCRAFPLTKASGEVLRLRQPVGGGRNRTGVNLDQNNKKDTKKPAAESESKEKKQTMDRQVADIAKNMDLLHIRNNIVEEYPVYMNQIDQLQGMKDELNKEYEELVKKPDAQVKFTMTEGYKKENKRKNRYRDVVPYDESRVTLPRYSALLDENLTDYINASYIRPQWMFDKVYPIENGIRKRIVTFHGADWEDIRDNNFGAIPCAGSQRYEYDTDKMTVQDAYDAMELYEDMDMPLSMFLGADALDYPTPTQIRKMDTGIPKDKFYIATQGCLLLTMHDFWSMISDNDVRVIAMVTQCVENGKMKCDQYWPSLYDTWIFGNLQVHNVAEYTHPFYIARELRLTVISCTRKRITSVYQYQYLEWPDHSVPGKGSEIVRFIRDINTRMMIVSQETTAPKHNILCVHCSAGAGRTGTFIAIDMLIDMIKTLGHEEFEPPTEIPAVVRLLRKQRPGMVHNVLQYRFIYDAVQNYFDNILMNNGIDDGPKVSY